MSAKRRHTEEDPEVVIHVRHRRRKDPARVAAGKALWAAKSPQEKQIVLDRLRIAREKYQKDPGKKARKIAGFKRVRAHIHRGFLTAEARGSLTKKEAKDLILDLQRDIGVTTRTKKAYQTSTVPPLPHLKNPLPQFFGKLIKQAIEVAKVPFKAQLHIIKNTIPIAEAIGIVPPGSSAFTILRLLFQNV